MTRADQNKGNLNYEDAMAEAVSCADNFENDYENEVSFFEWPDGSVSQFIGMTREVYTYGCRE